MRLRKNSRVHAGTHEPNSRLRDIAFIKRDLFQHLSKLDAILTEGLRTQGRANKSTRNKSTGYLNEFKHLDIDEHLSE